MFRRLHSGRDGRIWVELSPALRSDDDPSLGERIRYDVFEPDGAYLGAVDAPVEFKASVNPVFDGDHVWAVTRERTRRPAGGPLPHRPLSNFVFEPAARQSAAEPARPPGAVRTLSTGSRSSMRPRFATAILAAATLGTACRGPYPPPPGTARDPVVDTIHGVEFTDDYRWLEDQYGPATRAWIAEQNAYAELVVGDTALRAELAGRLRELMDVPGALFPRRAGDYEYFSIPQAGPGGGRHLPAAGARRAASTRRSTRRATSRWWSTRSTCTPTARPA